MSSVSDTTDDHVSLDELIIQSRGTYPVMVLQDRYGGTYSGGRWIAISVADRLENGAYRAIRCLEAGPSDSDIEAQEFWTEPPSWVAVGDTPDAAVATLLRREADQNEEALRDLDRKLQEGLDDLDAGRSHSVEEVLAFLKSRQRRAADAAE
jgi:hypothetical protein